MATYTRVSRATPSSQRHALITSVAVNDRIDIEDILGRPARGVIFHMTDAADIIGYRLNSLLRLEEKIEGQAPSTVLVWSEAQPAYSSTGATALQTQDKLQISSIEVTALTLSVGATIEITVW